MISQAKLRKAVRLDWSVLAKLAIENGQDSIKFLERAYQDEIEQERGHRRFCSFMPDDKYQLGVVLSAKLMIVQRVADPASSKRLAPADLMSLRLAVAYCYALRQALEANGRTYVNANTQTIDYTVDVAVQS